MATGTIHNPPSPAEPTLTNKIPQMATMRLAGVVNIANSVSLYRPQSEIQGHQSADTPDLVVLATFMDAPEKVIMKYIKGYQSLFPGASLLVMQSSTQDVFFSTGSQHKGLKIACETIQALQSDGVRSGSILLHAMSNGGGLASTQLAGILQEKIGTNVFDKVIYDCVPGNPNVEQCIQAISFALPKNLVTRFLARWFLRAFIHASKFFWVFLLRRQSMWADLAHQLNDERLFEQSVPRLYMYSKADKLINHDYVHAHAEQAKSAGFQDVKEVVFENAPHCGLVMEDPKLYWDSVKKLCEQ